MSQHARSIEHSDVRFWPKAEQLDAKEIRNYQP
jgi:hypothetical protein